MINIVDSVKKLMSNGNAPKIDFSKILEYISLKNIIIAVIIIIAGIVVWNIFKALRHRHIRRVGGNDKDMASVVIYRIVKIIIVLVCFICLLQNFGVNVSNAVTGLGVVGIVIGFALQDFLKDVIMGIHIMADKFFNIGDAVEFNGEVGIVKKFTLRTTEIELISDRSAVCICNRQIESIKRVSHMVDIDIPISYNEDVRYVHETFNKIVEKASHIENVEECQYKGTEKFEESAIIYKVRFFCDPNVRPDTRRAVLASIQDGLNDAGIKIPFNQLDVHLDK